MKRLIAGGFALCLLVVLAAAAVPFLVRSDWIRDRIITAVEDGTGLRLAIGGDVSVSLLPSLALAAKDVRLSRGDRTPFVAARDVRLGLDLTALLDGRVAVTALGLGGPRVLLHTGADGRPNWSGDAPPAPSEGAAPSGDAPSVGSSSGDGLAWSIERITITDGSIAYADERTGATEAVTGIDAETGLVDLARPLALTGRLTARGADWTVSATVAEPGALATDGASDLALALAADGGRLSVEGRLARSAFDGRFDLVADDVARFAAPLGVGPLPVRAVQAAGHLAAGGARVELTEVSFVADQATGAGEAALSLEADRPRVDLRMALDRLDLDALAAAPDTSDESPASAGTADGPGGGLDLAPIAGLDVGLDLRIGELAGAAFAETGPIRSVRLVGVAENGAITASLEPVKVLDGTAGLRLTAKPDAAGVRLDGRVTAEGFAASALSGLLAEPLPVRGRLSADMAFAAAGASSDQMLASLGAAGTVKLRDGTITGIGLADAFGDPSADRLTGVALDVTVRSLSEPIALAGTAAFRGEPFRLDVTADARAAAASRPFALTAAARSERLSLSFDGTVDPARSAAAGGIGIDAPSFAAALAVLDRPVERMPAGPVSIFGRIDVDPAGVRFGDAEFTLADTRLVGNASVDLAGKPRIVARLAGDTINLGALIGGASGAGAPRDASRTAADERRGWSDEPLDLSGLRGFDADVSVRASRVAFGGAETGPADVSIRNEAGRLQVDLPEFSLYGGTGSGAVTVDASGQVPGIVTRFGLKAVDALPFLAGATGFTRIEGKADLNVELQAAGGSERALVQALDGSLAFAFRDGALRGIDAAALLRSAAVAVVTGLGQSEGATTPFYGLTGTARIERGIMRNDDLALEGPLVRATGAGVVDMPARQIGYRFVPTLTAGSGEDMTFEVPIILEGPWEAPRIYPDISGILENPEAAYRKLRALGGAFSRLGKLEGDDVGRVVEELAPGIGAVLAPEGAPPGTEDALKDLIGGVLGVPRPKPDSAGQPAERQTPPPADPVPAGAEPAPTEPPPPMEPPSAEAYPPPPGPVDQPPPQDPLQQLLEQGVQQLFRQ
ncbi:AsmA family protein [Chthonobacter rhizosphaerae]|uniref:AsmA family protein n=1 Tax=Chthonobacter rhizosphaerae TaxID=2735553 RepID=UPI0015EEA469|nr:AsmA family protein [Chthonobacter rhizosphaerae]